MRDISWPVAQSLCERVARGGIELPTREFSVRETHLLRAAAEIRLPVATTPDRPVTSCPYSAGDEFHMHANHTNRPFRRCAAIVAVTSIAIVAPHVAVADIVTGTLKPASAKASLVNAKG